VLSELEGVAEKISSQSGFLGTGALRYRAMIRLRSLDNG
jgi:hypothetical protein